MDKLNLNDIYNLTRTLLKYKTNTEVWVSNEVMAKFIPVIEKAMKQGAKPDIKGIMCLGSDSFPFNERDTDIKEFL